MQPMQFSSFAVYIGNQPSLFGAVRHANTSTGHTARQNPQALHMSSVITTSQRPAGPRDGFLSTLKRGIGGCYPEYSRETAPIQSRGPSRVNQRSRAARARATGGPRRAACPDAPAWAPAFTQNRHWCWPTSEGTIRSITCSYRGAWTLQGREPRRRTSIGQG